MGELFDHLRHHRDQQNADDRDGDHGEGNRVDHRLRQLALHLLALLVVLRQLLQHVAQVAGFFTGHHQRAVELVKGARELAEGVEQGVTFHHLLADLHHHCRQLFVFRLLRDRLQRALERQCGVDQRGELTGKHRQHRRGEPGSGFCFSGRRRFTGFADADGHQLLLAQHLANLLLPLGLQRAALGFACDIRRRPGVEGHYASPPRSAVTRITSSSEVTPLITFSSPFSRRL